MLADMSFICRVSVSSISSAESCIHYGKLPPVQVRKQHVPVTIFLVNGVKLQGVITWFDNYSMLLKRDGHIQLIYKHAVSTIMPSTPVNMQDIEGNEQS